MDPLTSFSWLERPPMVEDIEQNEEECESPEPQVILDEISVKPAMTHISTFKSYFNVFLDLE